MIYVRLILVYFNIIQAKFIQDDELVGKCHLPGKRIDKEMTYISW